MYSFVRELLRDDVKPIKFILCALPWSFFLSVYLKLSASDQSPPKRDLKVSDVKVKGLSLSELQLAPASILLLRFEDDSLNRTLLEIT